ncbi:MAG TPA: CBS domain-containing protein [Byssovorax sp.]|jgi:acetoin utilization protein AcuB
MKREATVADYMTKTPHTIGADQTVARAHAVMRSHGIRHLPVLQAGELVGILTERDLAWIEASDEAARDKTLVDDAMTPFPYVARESALLREVAGAMAEGKYGATLVVDATGGLVGVFTTVDAMRALEDALRARSPRRAA